MSQCPICHQLRGTGGAGDSGAEYKLPEGGAAWQTRHPVRLAAATVALAAGWLTLALPSFRFGTLVVASFSFA